MYNLIYWKYTSFASVKYFDILFLIFLIYFIFILFYNLDAYTLSAFHSDK